ncbi:pentatricopeptide repeat-containing protein [Senna tora]|uniref:Pentatricopeptide repeat-containing protein n=1 Tax=Senna tora TaxID=362788 RepID=A0A835C5U3_9FABA|nr:pentatricopeptide repeat-containing protein [Senna tora]
MLKAQILHASIIKKGLHNDVYHCNLLLQAYTKSYSFSSAQKLLRSMPNANVVSHNTLLSGFFNTGLVPQALQAFSSAPTKDSHSWNILISGCVKNRRTQDAISHFMEMRQNSDLKPDDYTYYVLLSVCDLSFGCQIHAQVVKLVEAMQIQSSVIKHGFFSDPFITNSLLELYAKCGLVDYSLALFEEIKCKDVFAWTTIVTGLSQSEHMDDALWLFYEMQLAGVEPNSFTFGGLLAVCATQNTVQRGKQLHGVTIKHGFENNLVVGSAVSDMYSKCGEMQCAFKMFQSILERDIVFWNGIICGYAQNGEAAEALKLYNAMMRSRPSAISPNHATFVGVLTACSHGGLVKEGCQHFNDMIHKHMINPKIEHYTCMVDMLGRSGLLQEAEAFLLQMPFEANSVMWSTLLGACKLHRNLTMAKRISEHFHTKGPWNSSNYVLLANSYALMGEWNESLEIREMVNLRGLKKSMGCSWIEIGGHMHSFISRDKSHPQIEEGVGITKLEIKPIDIVNGLELSVGKIEELNAAFINRVSKMVEEVETARDWIKERKGEIKQAKDKVECLTALLDDKEEPEFLLREKVWNLEAKVSKEGGEKLNLMKSVSQLEKKVARLENSLKEKEEELVNILGR